MASIFVNPEEIRNGATRMETNATQIETVLADLDAKIASTEAIYKAQSGTDFREKFNTDHKIILENSSQYLKNKATFLRQGVAEPAESTDVAVQNNVNAIQK